MTGRISSFQSLGTVDGPGVRSVVFMQGCPLHCVYCHNPETWDKNGGTKVSAEDLYKKILRYRPYYKNRGGVTFSGGEPLLQADFLCEILKLCADGGIHTAIDTSGTVKNKSAEEAVSLCDLILLDIKFADNERYIKYTGAKLDAVLDFLKLCESLKKDVWVRQVIVEGLNSSREDVLALKELIAPYGCVKKVELLPFRKLCIEKYKNLGISFPLEDVPETAKSLIDELERIIAQGPPNP